MAQAYILGKLFFISFWTFSASAWIPEAVEATYYKIVFVNVF